MRLIMMGTGPFAVPTFESLYETSHVVVALVTAPLRQHRGQDVPPVSRLREIAGGHGTTVLDPESVNTPEAQQQLRACDAGLLVVCDYGQILSRETLATSRQGGINLHASLLPKYRGAAPINWAVYHGESTTGVTVIHMTPTVDAGPCIAQAAAAIGPDETAVELEARLSRLGAGLVAQVLDRFEAGPLEALPQDPSLASKAPRLKKTDGQIDWTRPAAAIKNQVRAMQPWPKTYTCWHRREGPPLRLILGPVQAVDWRGAEPPGTVIEASGNRLLIASGEGAVAPLGLQPSGKRLLGVEEFLRGYRVEPGDRFGPE